MPNPVDARALREQLSLSDSVDARSSDFLRFVIRFSEALNVDIPEIERGQLVTLAGCVEYLTSGRGPGPG